MPEALPHLELDMALTAASQAFECLDYQKKKKHGSQLPFREV